MPLAAVAALALAACGDDDDDDAAASTTAAPGTTGAAATTGPAATTVAPATTDAAGSATGEPSTGSVVAEREIFVTGSSTVEPISIAAGDAFGQLASGVALTVQGPGTGDGFAKFCAGEADISDASRAINEEEQATCADAGIEYIELKVAIDGLSVITSAENADVECLSVRRPLRPARAGCGRHQNFPADVALADEYAATVTDLGAVHTPYPDAELTVTVPGEESGTFDSFVELVIGEVGEALGVEDANVRVDYTASPNDNVIIEGVSANPTSLGWVGFAYVEENLDVVKLLQVDGGGGCVEPTAENVASGEYPIAVTCSSTWTPPTWREPGTRGVRRLLRQRGDRDDARCRRRSGPVRAVDGRGLSRHAGDVDIADDRHPAGLTRSPAGLEPVAADGAVTGSV